MTEPTRREAELRLDRIACTGHGHCVELLPELASLDEWGYPILHTPAIPTELRDYADAAVRACPRLALRLTPPRSGGPARNRQSTRQAPTEPRSR
jgi:ferredoxin